VIEYELPTPDIVPTIVEARYIKARDAFEEKSRKPTEIKEIYQDVVAAVALRTIVFLVEMWMARAVHASTSSARTGVLP